MKFLLKEFYIMRDAFNKRESRDFAQRIFRIIKDVEINDVDLQLNMIYINIDLDLKMFLPRFIERFIINSFLIELNDRKYK